ncbi:MAG: acylneuraminate cytidylyltransferase family protein, partial [Oscillospiraceae bacterium]
YVESPVFLRGGTKKLHDAKLAASFMKDTAVLDIDSEHDFELLSLLADYFYRTDREFGEVREHIESFIQK